MHKGTKRKIERQREILEYIEKVKKVKIEELADHFDYTPTTIIKDIKVLKQSGLIQTKATPNGGIFYVDP